MCGAFVARSCALVAVLSTWRQSCLSLCPGAYYSWRPPSPRRFGGVCLVISSSEDCEEAQEREVSELTFSGVEEELTQVDRRVHECNFERKRIESDPAQV